MYPLRRIAAYAIDSAVLLTPVGLAALLLSGQISDSLPSVWVEYAGFFTWIISTGVPVLVLGLCVGLTGRTPGKLLLLLRVTDRYGQRPGLQAAILREIAKAVSLAFICGALYAIYGLITSGRTFYDDWLGLEVDDLWQGGLTDVQKNWRKHMRESRR